jgi:hypothetical protein
MKIRYFAMLLLIMATGLAYAEDEVGYGNQGKERPVEYLQGLKPGIWICSSPEAYDQGIEEEKKWNGKDLEELKKQLLEKKLCMYVDREAIEKMMAPFATILERQGNKVKVSFTIENRKRLEYLHRFISRTTYAGWTDIGNLVQKEIL